MADLVTMLRDFVGPVRAKELAEEFGELIENLQILGYKEVKPWAEFMSAMKPPAQWDAKHVEQRVTTNFLYYRSNYLIICCGVVLFRIILSPLTLFSILLTLAFIGYVTIMVKVPLQIGELIIDNQKKNMACAAVSLLILSLSGTLAEMFWSILMAVMACVAHMLFRARSISSKMNKVQEEVKLNSHSHSGTAGGAGASSNTSKIVSGVNQLISEVFTKNSSQAQNKKHDVSVPNAESVSGANSPTMADIESRAASTPEEAPYHPSLSHHGSAVKRASPTHFRTPEKSD